MFSKLAGLQCTGRVGRGRFGGRLPNSTLDAGRAKLTREEFGDLRIYFDGPTEQLKIDYGGQPAAEGRACRRIRRISIPRRSSW